MSCMTTMSIMSTMNIMSTMSIAIRWWSTSWFFDSISQGGSHQHSHNHEDSFDRPSYATTFVVKTHPALNHRFLYSNLIWLSCTRVPCAQLKSTRLALVLILTLAFGNRERFFYTGSMIFLWSPQETSIPTGCIFAGQILAATVATTQTALAKANAVTPESAGIDFWWPVDFPRRSIVHYIGPKEIQSGRLTIPFMRSCIGHRMLQRIITGQAIDHQ